MKTQQPLRNAVILKRKWSYRKIQEEIYKMHEIHVASDSTKRFVRCNSTERSMDGGNRDVCGQWWHGGYGGSRHFFQTMKRNLYLHSFRIHVCYSSLLLCSRLHTNIRLVGRESIQPNPHSHAVFIWMIISRNRMRTALHSSTPLAARFFVHKHISIWSDAQSEDYEIYIAIYSLY